MKSLISISAFAAVIAAHPGPGHHGRYAQPRTITNAGRTTDWDYIVIGAGPSGIIVAQRLVEKKHKVLLLETGGPSYAAQGGNASTSWNSNGLTPFDVPSQNGYIFSSGVSGRCTDTPGTAGCLLGGGVSINAMVFVPPPAHDFDDNWPQGWKWSEVRASAEALYQRNAGTIKPSVDGEWYDTAEYTVLSKFLETSQGFSSVDAIASPEKKTAVFSHPPWNIQDGLRAGPVRSYLPLAQKSKKFSLQMYTRVLRVVRDGSRITGVEVENSKTGMRSIIKIRSSGRVILAAGSMTTPRLLINSGIGPREQINIVKSGTANITLPDENQWINLPVGTQIKDHPIINVSFNTTSNLTVYPFLSPSSADQQKYISSRSGAVAQGTQRLIFWDNFKGSDGVQRYVQGTTSVGATNQILIKFYLTHGAKSSGSLSVTTDGATVFSKMPYFTDAVDHAGTAAYITNFMDAAKAYGLIPANATATATDYMKDSFSQGTHFVGTAKIGTDDGRLGGEATVDVNTKVYGTDNLFVVDASIHADLPTGNTQAIVMVVAEHAAKKILACENKRRIASAST